MSKKLKRRFIFPVVLLIALASYLFVLYPYSATSSAIVLASYRTLRMEWILSSYAHQLEIKRRFLRELGGAPRGIPRNLDDGLIRILQSNGPARDREAILKFYIKALPWTQCCWQIAYSEDKTIIDDTLRLARSMSDREKYGALKLVESLRRDRNKEMAKESLHLKRIEDIQVVFKLYENWWESALPLSEKLKLHPLEKSPYAWSPPG